MDKSMYADTVNCRYPINSREAALESWKQANLDGAIELPEVRGNLDKAASYYGIQWPAQHKQAAARPSITYDLGNELLTLGKIASLDDLGKAADTVISLRDTHTRHELQKAAAAVLDVASWIGADMDEPRLRKISQIAGIGAGNREDIERELMKRATLNDCTGTPFWEAVRNVQGMSDEAFYKAANLNNLCDTMEDIDRHFNNTHRYGKDLASPESVVFGSNVNDLLKEASDLLTVPSVDTTVSKTAILERKDAIRGFFDAHFAKTASKTEETDEELFEKVASMDEITAMAFFSAFKD